jgi:hypothetical protein
MTAAGRSFVGVLLVSLVAGCAAKRLPPGTPPPEYETRELPAWKGDTPDAGSAAPTPSAPAAVAGDVAGSLGPTEQPKTEPAPVDAGPGPSPDAGLR